jgi:hypothetical protein
MNNTANDPLDLGLNLAGVDTSSPVLEKGLYAVTLDDVTKADNSRKDGYNLVVKWKTVQPATSVQGRAQGKDNDVNPGWTLTQWYGLQQSDNPNAPDYKKGLAALQDALEGTTMETRNPSFSPLASIGKTVMISVDVRDDEQRGLQNDIKRVMPMPA